jgi:tRNA(Arg) A34 adenosine deaminase TadA
MSASKGETLDQQFLREAIALAEASVGSGGGPFGAVVVHAGRVVGRGNNCVVPNNDPTAHAEIVAIRAACAQLNEFHLTGCILYVNCEPCPMCFSAASWAHIERIVYAASREDAAAAGFDDVAIHQQVMLPPSQRNIPMQQQLHDEALKTFELWKNLEGKIEY